LWVFYVQSLLRDKPSRFGNFSNPSTPTEKRSLKAGEYLMWSQKEPEKPKEVPKWAVIRKIENDTEEPRVPGP
jgi:hypothetical protein